MYDVELPLLSEYNVPMPRQLIDDIARETLRPYIMECFRRRGVSFKVCGLCGITDKKLDIHHTKYDNATVYDLLLVCRSCNLSAGQLHLA